MRLRVQHPKHCFSEYGYIFSVLIGEFLGLEYEAQPWEEDTVRISSGDRFLELPDVFFKCASANWLHQKSMPAQPLSVWNSSDSGLDIKLSDSRIPVIMGNRKLISRRIESSSALIYSARHSLCFHGMRRP